MRRVGEIWFPSGQDRSFAPFGAGFREKISGDLTPGFPTPTHPLPQVNTVHCPLSTVPIVPLRFEPLPNLKTAISSLKNPQFCTLP